MHIKRWASQDQGDEINPTFYKIFRKGQILFPTRNPHLRRAVLASFDGICGEKTLTLEPNLDAIRPEFIPFLFHSESFYAHTTSSIIGSTNPHCRWRDVAKYEFLLPPKTQQVELAELLWAMDEVLQKELATLDRLNVLTRSYEKEVLVKYRKSTESKLPAGYRVFKLEEIAEVTGGSTPSRNNPEFWGGDIPWLTPTDVTTHNRVELYETKENITRHGLKEISNRLYPPGSILYCSRATIGFAVINAVPMATNQGFSNFICNDKVDPYFLYFLLKHLTPDLTRLAGGSTFLEISKSAMRNFKIVLPDDDSMKNIRKSLLKYESTRLAIEAKLESEKSLQKSLINQVF